ncbi:hypothetical protein [Rhodococcoides kyotonense]|uniref:Uncharacterized protein n=1 Tax=Rhodococcoides kyotonense TaxID=398843 RepID=A0A239LGZ6_9NOCA|nr:hypothetical protein [Rhodococcus kyotonensis]SNT29103.1 hypothetical protein SAMN05421642_1139 [Rhodococcus kyotonensis]
MGVVSIFRAVRLARGSRLGVVVLVLLVSGCGVGRSVLGIDTVSYRPPNAEVVAAAECLSENIYTALTGLGPWDPALTANAPEPGYPFALFEPVAVVRCERGIDDAGKLSVDTVRLDGDIDAVTRAFAADSERFADHIFAECAYFSELPAGLWLVDESGRALRPAWPTIPCGMQQAPLDALRALEEVSRTSHPTGVDVAALSCGGEPGIEFETTTAEYVDAAVERERADGRMLAPALAMPTDDVRALSVCRYPVLPNQDPPEYVPGSTLVLGGDESVSVVDALLNAPIAQPCSDVATRLASADLLRADGSGGAYVVVELDGCRRVSGFGAYRQAPDGVVDALARIPFDAK